MIPNLYFMQCRRHAIIRGRQVHLPLDIASPRQARRYWRYRTHVYPGRRFIARVKPCVACPEGKRYGRRRRECRIPVKQIDGRAGFARIPHRRNQVAVLTIIFCPHTQQYIARDRRYIDKLSIHRVKIRLRRIRPDGRGKCRERIACGSLGVLVITLYRACTANNDD